MNNVNYQHHGDIGKLNKNDTIKDHPFTKNCYNSKLAKYSVMFEVPGKDELVLNQLEDWKSRPVSWKHCSNYIGYWEETHSKE